MDGLSFSPTTAEDMYGDMYGDMFEGLGELLLDEPALGDPVLSPATRTATLVERVASASIAAVARPAPLPPPPLAPLVHVQEDRSLSIVTAGLEDLALRTFREMGFDCPPAPKSGHDIVFNPVKGLWFVVKRDSEVAELGTQPQGEGEAKVVHAAFKRVRFSKP